MAGVPRRVTIREVAVDSGLSIATVSRALTGSRPVGPDIAQRAQESAARLGYRTDSIGRSLRTQRTNTLGLVIPDIANPFFPSLVQAVERAARDQDLSVLIADAANDPVVEQAALRSLIDHRVDAILISPSHLTASRSALAESSTAVPLLQIDRVIDDSLPYVRANQSRPVQQLVAHLRSRGRRNFAFIAQPDTIATSFERESAFRELMADGPLRVVPATTSAGSGRDAARELMVQWPETDAVICANDLLGVGALRELRTLGRADVAVSGFDDTLIAEALGLTSVRQPVDELAVAAIAAVLAPAMAATRHELDCTVIFRESTE
jgi:LacI family transcriptional regulator